MLAIDERPAIHTLHEQCIQGSAPTPFRHTQGTLVIPKNEAKYWEYIYRRYGTVRISAPVFLGQYLAWDQPTVTHAVADSTFLAPLKTRNEPPMMSLKLERSFPVVRSFTPPPSAAEFASRAC